jgi:hypothetical protein
MPITSDLGGKNYTLGRGRVFFDRFTPAQVAAGITAATQGEGERYFGNTTEFNMTSEEEVLDHFSSEGGIRVKDDSVSLQLDRTGTLTTDHIDATNLALLFLSDGATSEVQSAAVASTQVVTVKQGMFYQIGASETNPSGVRIVSNVVIAKGVGFATNVAAATNWEVDEALGRLYIIPGSADIPDDTEIEITYDVAAATREQVISKSQSIYGALRFVADNPKGSNRDYYMPYCKLSPNGDYNLKGDDWQTMSFTFEVLQKASNIQGVYIDGRAVAS